MTPDHLTHPRPGDTYTLDGRTCRVVAVEPRRVVVECVAPDGTPYSGPLARPLFARSRASWTLVRRGG